MFACVYRFDCGAELLQLLSCAVGSGRTACAVRLRIMTQCHSLFETFAVKDNKNELALKYLYKNLRMNLRLEELPELSSALSFT